MMAASLASVVSDEDFPADILEAAAMDQNVYFGLSTMQIEPYHVMAERWRHLEQLGFDSLWLAGHFVHPYAPQQDWLEAWTLLAALATQTERVHFGTLVSPVGLVNPAVLAKQALTLDRISRGRLDIGLGTGRSNDPGFRMLGVANWMASRAFRNACSFTRSSIITGQCAPIPKQALSGLRSKSSQRCAQIVGSQTSRVQDDELLTPQSVVATTTGRLQIEAM
jgi:luciferase-like monooxygenase